MDIVAGLERHIERARRAGATQENAERSGVLWLSIQVRELRGKLAAKMAGELAAALPILAGKAVTDADRAAVRDLRAEFQAIVGDELEQAALRPGESDAKALEGKSFFFPAEWDRDVERLLRAIGGYRIPGAEGGPGGFDDAHFARALALIEGRGPASDAEAAAIERFRSKHGEGVT